MLQFRSVVKISRPVWLLSSSVSSVPCVSILGRNSSAHIIAEGKKLKHRDTEETEMECSFAGTRSMREFFHGWRRKAGCVALVMACLLMVVWVRSLFVLDKFLFSQKQSVHAISSMDGNCSWLSVTPFSDVIPSGWSLQPRWVPSPLTENSRRNHNCFDWNGIDIHWRWHWDGFNFGAISSETFGTPPNDTYISRHEIWQIPYWFIILPLTLLSAYLILWKPRKRTAVAEK